MKVLLRMFKLIIVSVSLLVPTIVFSQNPFSSPFEDVNRGSTSATKPDRMESSVKDIERVTTWRLIGVMVEGNRKVAMLDLSDGRVIVVKEGEVIDRIFKVVRIGDGYVVIGSKGKQRKITFLGGNR